MSWECGPVVVPAGLLGFVEAIQPHLARVRLLAAPRARIAVVLAESRPGLPGELNGLNAVLEGTGEGGRLVEGARQEVERSRAEAVDLEPVEPRTGRRERHARLRRRHHAATSRGSAFQAVASLA